MQWHTLPVEAYGMTHTALHGRLPRILWITGNIQLYTRINLRTYGATPTTLQHSTDTVRSHGVETPPSRAAYPRMYEKGAACARSGVDIWGLGLGVARYHR